MNPAMNSDYRQKRQKRQSCDAFDVFDASLDPSLYLLTTRSLRVLSYVLAFSEWHISCFPALRDLKHLTLTFCR